jgi:hypothetical protein
MEEPEWATNSIYPDSVLESKELELFPWSDFNAMSVVEAV